MHKQTIALIDDDRNILTSLSIALEKEGFKIQTYILQILCHHSFMTNSRTYFPVLPNPPDPLVDSFNSSFNSYSVLEISGLGSSLASAISACITKYMLAIVIANPTIIPIVLRSSVTLVDSPISGAAISFIYI